MTGSSKFALFSKPGFEDEIQPGYRSMRFDPLVWAELEKLTDQDIKQIAEIIPGGNLNPGNFALYLLDSSLINLGYPNAKLQPALLEECMTEFQLFLQNVQQPMDFKQAAQIAVVLIEKRKIESNWGNIFSELSSRFHEENSDLFVQKWQTSLGIVVNLVEDKSEFLSAICENESGKYFKNLFVPVMMMVSLPNSERIPLAENSLGSLGVEEQVNILRDFILIGEEVFSSALASSLIKKYEYIDTSSKGLDLYWDRPTENLSQVASYQAIAMIAKIAGDQESERKLLAKAGEILASAQAGVQIQQLGLKTDASEPITGATIAGDELINDPAVTREISFFRNIPAFHKADASSSIQQSVKQAKEIASAGNEEVAINSLMAAFQNDPDNFTDNLLNSNPRFDPTWQPVHEAGNLSTIGAAIPAEKLLMEILKKNPVNQSAVQNINKLYKKSGNWTSLAKSLEAIVFCGNPTDEDLRDLITVYSEIGKDEESLEISGKLLAKSTSNVQDKNTFALTALKLGKTSISRKAVDEILDSEPENSQALCTSGKVFIKDGDLESAKLVLSKAIDKGTDQVDPWIILSDLYTDQSELNAAIEILRKALIALPGNRELKIKLAALLLNQGSAAEALPLLNEIRGDTADLKSNLLLMKTMKGLHLDEFNELVDELYQIYPEQHEIAYEYASKLMKSGELEKSAKILKQLAVSEDANPEWILSYVDAAVGQNPKWSKRMGAIENGDLDRLLYLVNSQISQSHENSKAYLLKAEILQKKGLVEEANKILNKLIEDHPDLDKDWFQRLQTWFAWTSAFLGKIDIALATMRDVIDAEPTWVGAQQALTEILALSEESQSALEQADRVLEIAPDVAENLLWAGDIFSSLGETEKATQVLTDGAKQFPDDLRFDLAKIKIQENLGQVDEVITSVKSLKNRINSEQGIEIVNECAKILDKQGDSSTIENLLQQRLNELKGLQNILDLAGYYYQHGQFEKCLSTLEMADESSQKSDLLAFFEADTLARLANFNQALDLLASMENVPVLQKQVDATGFIPEDWLNLANCKSPMSELTARISYEMGDVDKALTLALDAKSNDDENIFARLIGIESARAMAKPELCGQFSDPLPVNNVDPFYSIIVAEALENKLDAGLVDEAWEIYNQQDDSVRSTPFLKVVEVNLLWFEGNISEAEEIFDNLVDQLINQKDRSLLVQTSTGSLMIKTAIRLSRWNEALSWSHDLARQLPWHKTLTSMYLEVLVKSLEFRDRSQLLDIILHSANSMLANLNIAEEFDWIRLNSESNEEQEHWLLRGTLAESANQQNIKAFALLKPEVDDLVAMMAALQKTGQESTALQVGKKFSDNDAVAIQSAICTMDKDPELAIPNLNNVISHNQNNVIAIALRGFIYKKIGKTDLAVVDFESVLTLWTKELAWHKTAADLWSVLGNEGKAIQHLQYIQAESPLEIESGVKLGKGYITVEKSDEAIELLKELSQKEPNRFEIWEVLTDAYMAEGQIDNALKTAERASEVNPFSVKPYLLRAKMHIDQGQIDEALSQVKLADEKVKNNGELKVFLAKVYLLKGEKVGALAELEKINDCKDLSSQTILDEIKLVKEINGSASARNLIEYFSKQMPENAELLSMLAESQLENGDARGAESTARRVLKINPESLKMLVFLGKQQMNKGQLDQAIHSFSQAIKLHPEVLEVYFLLAGAFEKQRESAKAIDIMKQVTERSPKEIQAYVTLANLYKDAKNYRMAEEMLKKAVEIDPKNVSIKRQLGALLALNLVHQSQEVSAQS